MTRTSRDNLIEFQLKKSVPVFLMRHSFLTLTLTYASVIILSTHPCFISFVFAFLSFFQITYAAWFISVRASMIFVMILLHTFNDFHPELKFRKKNILNFRTRNGLTRNHSGFMFVHLEFTCMMASPHRKNLLLGCKRPSSISLNQVFYIQKVCPNLDNFSKDFVSRIFFSRFSLEFIFFFLKKISAKILS